MSSTPLSGNAIRSPNGAPSLSNKTNPQLPDMRCAASQTRDQHTIVIWLILFVYMKTQRSVSPYCAAAPHTMRCIIGCWLWRQRESWWHPGPEWWIVKRGKEWIRVLVEYFFHRCSLHSIHVFVIQQTQCYNHWSVYVRVYCKFSLHCIQMRLLRNITA